MEKASLCKGRMSSASAFKPACPVRVTPRRNTPTACALNLPRPQASERVGHAQRRSYSQIPHLPQSASSSRSAAFGARITTGNRFRALPGVKPYIHAAAYKRGSTLVVCAALAGVEEATDMRSLLDSAVAREDNLVVGKLANGLEYVILPNKLPPQRFEAHLEIHAGSVDELTAEQGIAHLVEHVTFLGSRKREMLLGTGARANAYTDFHHTVFHIHAPVHNSSTGQAMLPQVLDALEEIAFGPQFLASRIEKERKAVLAEAQMMNTIEYRVDCQLLTYLHEENNLGCRFPIGMTEQVKQWDYPAIKDFWAKWYFPANATLYVVGDLDRDTKKTQELIEKTFGKLPAGRQPVPKDTPEAAAVLGAPKERHAVRPPVQHKWGFGPLEAGEKPAEVKVFRHPLLQNFMLSVFCKLPIQSMTMMRDLKQMLMLRIVLSVFQCRINKRYVDGQPSFSAIELDISDSGREGCAVSTLTITSPPATWQKAVETAVQEVRRLQRHGLTHGEFERYCEAILRDSSQLAEQADKIPSVDTLNFVMESLACKHTVMNHREAHDAMMQVAGTITLEEINTFTRSMMTFASDYAFEADMLEDAAKNPGNYSYLGPTRTTSIVACIPAFIDSEGQSISSGGGTHRGNSLGAGGHIDADQINLEELEQQSAALDEFEVPEGAQRFELDAAEVAAALAERNLETEPMPDVETPQHLVTDEELEALMAERQPSWVHPGRDSMRAPEVLPAADESSGVVQRRLSNGVRINYRHTDNETRACLLRVIVSGGRATEKMGGGPDGFGAVCIGARTMSESGTLGSWAREEVEAFCVANLINCALDTDEENILIDCHFPVTEGNMRKTFELIHLFIEDPVWDESAMERAKSAYKTAGAAIQKSLERASADRIMGAMLGTDRRLRDPTSEEIDALTLEGMKAAVQRLLTSGNLELNVVGDFDTAELEDCCLKFMGTLRTRPTPADLPWHPVTLQSPPMALRHQTWHLTDSDERASAYISGPAPCRWGAFGTSEPLPPLTRAVQAPLSPAANTATADLRSTAQDRRRKHPLYSGIVLMLLTEIINSRLFTTVRDSLGLTYDVSFEVTLFDRIRSAWYSVHVTAHPDKIFEALNASIGVLRGLIVSPISRRELARAKTTLLTRHESDLKDNVYWLGLLTHLQNELVPYKTVECFRDLQAMYQAITVEDVQDALTFFNFENEHIFTCVGTSGKTVPNIPPEILKDFAYLDTDGWEEDDDQQTVAEAAQNMIVAPNGAKVDPMALFTAMMSAAQSMAKGPSQPNQTQK